MSSYQDWQDAVVKAAGVESLESLEKDVSQVEGVRYPLLAEAVSGSAHGVADWKLRLALCQEFEESRMGALSEDVDQLLWVGEGDGPSPEFLDLAKEEPAELSFLPCWTRQVGRDPELAVVLDLQVLRNTAELRRLKRTNPSLAVVGPTRPPGQETESLVEDTLVYLTGILAGATVLEVRQAPGETWESLWSRLNILRILKWESGLQGLPSVCEGSGFFAELEERLTS